ncbi:MAG: hypothetical protein JXM71_03710 [Spirochaetales bacterium]|nr:hypothetical protein [Spirochaetales bacterium]
MRISSLLVATIAVLASSCASLGDPFVLVFSVDDEYKSEAVTASGVDAYRESLVRDGDVSASPTVQRYFEVALRYDPANDEAARYLALVEDYRASKFSASLKTAEALLDKPKRSAAEEYRMLIAVRDAAAIYPGDDEARSLLKATEEPRKAFVVARLEEAEAMRAALAPDASDAARERVYIDAFRQVLKVRELVPRDVEGSRMYRELRSDITDIVEARLAGVDELIKSKKFTEARTVLALVDELDTSIGRTFSGDIQDSRYRLYLAWAASHEAKREWPQANARLREALAIQKGSEALAMQKRISAAIAAADKGASFEAGLKSLDARIREGDLIKAQRVLSSMSSAYTASSQRQQLDKRRKQMFDALGGIYASGVEAYRAERFKDAIALLEVVVAVDATYQEAADYLEKARDKQRLLDQY